MAEIVAFPNSKRQESSIISAEEPLALGIRELYLAILYHALVRRDKEAANKLMKFAAGASLTGPAVMQGTEISWLLDQVQVREIFSTLVRR